MRFKGRVKALTKRNQGRSLGQVIATLSAYLRRWIGYFGFCQTSSVLRDLDSWIRHRLRCLQWKQWKVYSQRKAELSKRGIQPELAHTTVFSAKGPWRISHTPGVRMALNNQFFDHMGLIRLRAYPNNPFVLFSFNELWGYSDRPLVLMDAFNHIEPPW